MKVKFEDTSKIYGEKQKMIEYVVYHGKFLKTGEDIWYAEFNKQKEKLKAQKIKTDLGQILLTGRPTDMLILAFENGIPIANGWGRLLKTYTHVDRIFVFPEHRGKKISVRMIQYFLKKRRGLIWNAVHDAMDHTAAKFKGVQGTVDGYRGWVLLATNYPGNLEEDLQGVPFYVYCEKCKQKVIDNSTCSSCGAKFPPGIEDKAFTSFLSGR